MGLRNRKKRVRDQVIVITGATSGIGLATACLAAARGARLVLASRNEKELQEICGRIHAMGGEATWVKADVARREDVEEIARTALEEFGGFDTWVNNAGVTIFGRLEDVPLEDERRLFDVNFWGVVHGSLIALEYLGTRGGTIINIGSVLSYRAVPLQGTYVASKHAVKAFSEALRMEIEKERLPVAITLVAPGTIDTPYPHHARNFLESKAIIPPPYYAPEVVARAILRCAGHPVRDVKVGGFATALVWMDKLFPRTTDRIMKRSMFRQQVRKGEPPVPDDGLYSAPRSEGEVRGGYPGHVSRTSLYTAMRLHPVRSALTLGALVAAARAGTRRAAA